MADIDLTKKIVKALDPNFLLAQENLISHMDIARKIDSASKTKAGLNYIKKGIEKIYHSSATATANATTATPPPPEFKIRNPMAKSKTRKWRNPFKSKNPKYNPKKSSTNFNIINPKAPLTIKNPAANPSYVQPAKFIGTSTSGGASTRKTRKKEI
jgi:hypothetical protein